MSNGILNFYELINKKNKDKDEPPYKNFDKVRVPLNTRVMISGSSGSGKTNVLLNFIFSMNCFTRYYLFIKNDTEPLYAFLIKELRDIEKKLGKKIVFVYNDLSKTPQLNEFDTKENNLIVYDDMVLEKSKTTLELFMAGRKKNCTIFYLTQSYFQTEKFIRNNCDIFVFKKLTRRDVNMILREFSFDLKPDELIALYNKCDPSKVDHFFMIDNSPTTPQELKYRCGFEGIKM